jgi:ABC-type lipoprotein release transport system permease subunit
MALVGVFAGVGGIILGVAVAGVVFVYLSRTIIRKWKSAAYSHVL